METNKKRPAQDIDIDNNPVNKDIIPENKNNTDKDIKEETPTTPTPVITEEIKPIEEMTDPNPLPPTNPDENPTGTSNHVIERPKNTVRYIDSGFTF
jgi:hypothetical protein